MHRSLTSRGFKSFASSTTLRFEPGITCVVGPNGRASRTSSTRSPGSWGSRAPSRFAAARWKTSSSRAPAGARRSVAGAADHRQQRWRAADRLQRSHSASPVPQRQLRIRHQRHTESAARRPRVAERLRHRPRDARRGRSGAARCGARRRSRRAARIHRGAAGVLKHRKRKEKALRKLEAMQVNLARLQDLTAELRRQLKPLGRQADVARRAAVVQADVRDARLRLLPMTSSSCEPRSIERSATRKRARSPRRRRAGARRSTQPRGGADGGRTPRVRYSRGRRRPGTTCPPSASGFAVRDRSRLSASASSRPRLTTRAVAVTPSSSSARLHRPAPRSAPCVPTSRRTAAV